MQVCFHTLHLHFSSSATSCMIYVLLQVLTSQIVVRSQTFSFLRVLTTHLLLSHYAICEIKESAPITGPIVSYIAG